ncbi:hypothetical protein [uncultured Serratia sp.]|uniref:hypothetical protein n=1 Tax=uncultured Serratia sp. TaxID=239175 RepID=UPI0025835AD8|nr:hypothetical protein [uncultured Serratia sp.]BEM41647.1 hypothetical protein SME13J_02660 [Serratia marcescens]
MFKNSGKFDASKLKSVLTKLEKAKRLSVAVGVPAAKNAARGETNNATIAAVHEFGAVIQVTPKMRGFLHHAGIHLKADTAQITVPERSFLRSTVAENKAAAASFLARGINAALTGDADIKTPFDALGRNMAGLAQRKIQSGIAPPLSAATIARKGSSKPLIDSGQLVQSITWEVRDD